MSAFALATIAALALGAAPALDPEAPPGSAPKRLPPAKSVEPASRAPRRRPVIEEAPPPDPPNKALILRAVSQAMGPKYPAIEETSLAAFSRALEETASQTFTYRRFLVVAGVEAEAAVKENVIEHPCMTSECARTVAEQIGASHVVYSRLTRKAEGACLAIVSLEVIDKRGSPIRKHRDIPHCSASALLSAAAELGQAIAEGEREPLRITLPLTSLPVPSIDVADVPFPTAHPTRTGTTTRIRHGFTLERALEVYAEKHMFVFEEPAHPDSFFVARNGRIINECDVRRAASAPISNELRERCEGNDWEWAWAVLPVGLLISGLTAHQITDGGALRFLFGVSLSAVSASLALILNKDAVPVESGHPASNRPELESIVARSNEDLRQVLDLTEEEVEVAGMRR